MEYGLFFQLPRSSGQDTATRYRETLGQIVLGDELGFDTAWLAEMHFVPEYSIMPAPMMVGATAAAMTKRIRIGIGAALLPLHEPVRAAEDAATLDILSGGRLELGIGRGAIAAHFDGFGIPMSERPGRFNEVIDIIQRSWRDEPLTFHGEYFSYDNVNVEPKPLQKPGPPLRLAANSEEQITRAGQEGWRLMFSPITGTLPDLKARSELYRELRTQRDGTAPPSTDIGWLAAVHVAADGAQAREEARESLTAYLQVVAKTSTDGYVKHGGDPNDLPSLVRRFRDSTYEDILDEMSIVGSPDECREKLATVTREYGAGHILTWFNAGGLIPHEAVQRSMRLWMDEVVS